MARQRLELPKVRELISYDPALGEFTRNQDGNSWKAGDVCGTINSNGYRVIKLKGKAYKASHLAHLLMTGTWPSKVIDHINRVKRDDRWANLRHVSQSENCLNRVCSSKLGVRGVSERGNSFRFSGAYGKHIATYKTLEEAKKASDNYWGDYHGSSARSSTG